MNVSVRYKEVVRKLSHNDPVMRQIIRDIGPCKFRPEGHRTVFEALVRAIAHQQLHGKAAGTILKRFLSLFPQVKYFPSPEQVLKLRPTTLRSVGFSLSKVTAIRDIAEKVSLGIVPVKSAMRHLSDAEIIAALIPLRGVGRWTAEMFLIFTLGRGDVLPVDDFGIREGFRVAYSKRRQPTPKALALFGRRWAPYRTIASWYLWRIADEHKKIKD